MSKATWRKEFYPHAAGVAAKGSWRAAIIHSIKKWRGLSKAALKKHGLEVPPISVDAESCALCKKVGIISGLLDCSYCPIYKTHGIACDSWRDAPYWVYTTNGKTKPMLDSLKAALAWQEKQDLNEKQAKRSKQQ